MIIDFHTHCFPDALAPRALAKLAHAAKTEPLTDGTAAGLVRKMNECGIDLSVVANIVTSPAQLHNVNEFARATKAAYPCLYPLGSLHPDCTEEDMRRELLSLKESGINGLKIHPDYIGMMINDPALDSVFSLACEYDMFILTHAGWDFISPDLIHCTPRGISDVLNRFPSLRLIAAHGGSLRLWDDVEKYLCGRKNICFDLSLAVKENLPADQCRRIIESHGAENILFGTDLPWCDPCELIEYVKALDLPDDDYEAIMHKNAEGLLGI